MLPLVKREYQSAHPAVVPAYSKSREQFTLATCAERPDLFNQSVALENATWDRLSFLDYTAAHHTHYEDLLERFPECRLCMVEVETGEMVATGMCVPLSVNDGSALPDEGWDWIVDTAMSQKNMRANTIGALSISVPEQHRHRGFARDMINMMRAVAGTKKCWGVIAPVRPSVKSEYPLVSMDEYVSWTDSRGRIFDPWLRSHVAAGGKINGVCARSMVVDQPIEFWRDWAEPTSLESDGTVPFAGALAPLHVNTRTGMARYVEANVWVTHRL
jgi:hypothetical protein